MAQALYFGIFKRNARELRIAEPCSFLLAHSLLVQESNLSCELISSTFRSKNRLMFPPSLAHKMQDPRIKFTLYRRVAAIFQSLPFALANLESLPFMWQHLVILIWSRGVSAVNSLSPRNYMEALSSSKHSRQIVGSRTHWIRHVLLAS